MNSIAAFSLTAQLLLSSPLLGPVADGVPTLNVQPSCRAAARAQIVPGRDIDGCLTTERNARDQLSIQWVRFAPADRAACTALSTADGSASYVELLSCLEGRRDAREIARKQEEFAPTGMGVETTGSR